MFSGLPQVADIVRSAFQYLANLPPTCGSRVLGRAIPCSDPRQQRHKIIRKRVALRRDKSVSVVTVGIAPTPTDPPVRIGSGANSQHEQTFLLCRAEFRPEA